MDKEFLKKTLRIALPVMLQYVMVSVTNVVDVFMIGKLGETAIAGTGLASKVFFVLTLIVFGTASGLGVLAAQYWGQRDMKRIYEVTGIALTITLTVSGIFTVVCLIDPVGVMHIFTDSDAVAQEGAVYLRAVCLSYPLIALINTLTASLRSIERVNAPIVSSCIGIGVNMYFNYCLIFGHLGAPALGVQGAGIATVIARACELIAILLYIRKNRLAGKGWAKQMFRWEPAVLKQYATKSIPVTLNETFWGLGITMYSLCYGRISEGAAAAMTIVETYTDIELIGVMGLSTATAIILGNELGAGKLEEARRHASCDMLLALIVGVILAVITFLIRKPYMSLYDITPELEKTINQCLLVYCVAIIFRGFNTVTVVGILRSGGDTIVCALIDILPIWFFTVPMVFLTGLYWKLPLYMVFAVSNCDELIKFFVGYIRVKQYKWLKNLNLELTEKAG